MNIILNPGLAFGTGSGVLAIASLKVLNCKVDPSVVPLKEKLKNKSLLCRAEQEVNSICLSECCFKQHRPERMQLLLMPSNNNDTEAHSANEALRQNSYCKDAVLETNKYDVVIANILLNPLLDLAESIVSYAKPGATIALSGVLIEQIPQIIERYSSFMDNMTSTQIDDYACITGRRMKDVHT
ncbi:unnamed protein product [Rhodiola kirilowii]